MKEFVLISCMNTSQKIWFVSQFCTAKKKESENFQSQGPNRIFCQKCPIQQSQETISPRLRQVGSTANLLFPFSAKIWEKRVFFYIIPVYHLVNINLAHQNLFYVFVWAFEKDVVDGYKEFIWGGQCSAFENKI
jgi:hypothetical protein